jgi:pyruvate/2-oxoglutarate dehydrogenase complex dihydrolipoamide acyltransferase (E2) component
VGQAFQQAQEAVGQAAQPAQEVGGRAAEQAQGFAEQATDTAKKELHTTKAAKRKAEELGVDLSNVAGSGPDGRITLYDVKSAVQKSRFFIRLPRGTFSPPFTGLPKGYLLGS